MKMPAIAAALMIPLLSVAAVVAVPGTAQAHDELISSTPASNAALAAAPSAIVLKFAAAPLAGTAKIAANTLDGNTVALGDTVDEGATVSAPWPAGQPDGTYVVSWRNVGSDGHPLTGTFSFSYGAATSPKASEPAAGPGTALPAPAETSSEFTWYLPTFAGIAIILLAIIAGFAFKRVRSRGDSDTGQ